MIKIEELFCNSLNSFMLDDLKYIANTEMQFDKLSGKTILVVGDIDSLNSFVTLSLLFRNDLHSENIKVISVGSDLKQYDRDDLIVYENFFAGYEEISKRNIDFIIYLSSNDESIFKATPGSCIEREKLLISSVMALAMKKNARVLFVSAMEIYGAIHNGFKPIKENDVGYICLKDSRNLVGLSARFGETFAYNFANEKNISISFARLPIVYGSYNSGVFSVGAEIFKLLLNSVRGTAVLPQLPDEKMSVAYITDCVRAVLFLLLNGENHEAYNIAFDKSIVTFRDILNTADKLCGRTPSFGVAEESSYMTQCRILDGTKLLKLGFKNSLTLEQGIYGALMKFKTRSEISQ